MLLSYNDIVGRRSQVVRRGTANPLCVGSIPTVASNKARVLELVDRAGLKPAGVLPREGSSPSPGTSSL